MDPYNILGVKQTATPNEIKAKYKKLAGKFHPDREGGDTKKFQEIQSAYETLKDPGKRRAHDAGPRPTHFDFSTGDAMADFFKQRRRNKDIRVYVSITLASTLADQTKTISLKQHNMLAPVTVVITIPKGSTDQSTIRYSKMGDKSIPELTPGDLYAIIHILPSKFEVVDTYTVMSSVDVTAFQAMLGTTVIVTGIDDKIFSLTVPPATQPNTKLRLKEQGLFAKHLNKRADLIVNVNVSIPTLTKEQQSIIQSL